MEFFQWFTRRKRDQDSTADAERSLAEHRRVERSRVERRRAERSLQLNEQRYRAIVETAGSVLIGLDLQCRIFEWNRSAERVFGHKREDVINRNYGDLGIFTGATPPLSLDMDKVLKGNGSQVFESTIQIQDGRDCTLLWTISPLIIGESPPGGIIAIGQDITERKRIELQLLESEKRLNFILNTAADGIITISATGQIESVNRAAEQMFGYTREEMRGQRINLLMPEVYRKQHDVYLKTEQKKIMGQGRVVPGLRRDGSIFSMDITIGEARMEEGRMFIAVVRDMSHRPTQDYAAPSK
ncbi:MAG: PAS domain S-box protein [Motiliproteus sp.]